LTEEPNDVAEEEAGGPAEEETAEDPPDPMEQLQAERNKLKDQLLRTAADFDNFRKRSKRDLEDAASRSREEILRELLPVIDNLERAVAAADSATDPKSVAEGVAMVLKQFEDVGSRIGVERIQSVGQRFDPQIHDAVQQIESEEHETGTIVAEVLPGYSLRGRLVRPSMVVVARPPAGAKPSAPPQGDAEGEEEETEEEGS
jgi:molecular chaperone GrpE